MERRDVVRDEAGGLGTDVADPIEALKQRSLDRLMESNRRPYYVADDDTRDRDRYYVGIDLDADAGILLATLAQLIAATHERRPPYEPSERLYPWVDLHPDGHLRNIYSGTRVDPEEVIRADSRIAKTRTDQLIAAVRSRPAIGAVELHAAAQEVEHTLHFNCEHVVPQSWYERKEPMRGDLHHLFTCEPTCNTKRANIPYAELSDLNTSIAGCGLTRGDSGFEPFAGKGPVARATMYFLLRYPGVIGDRAVELQGEALSTLLSWHNADAVSTYERHRNASVFEIQGNRNPFIDFPELGTRLDLLPDFGRPGVVGAPTESSLTI